MSKIREKESLVQSVTSFSKLAGENIEGIKSNTELRNTEISQSFFSQLDRLLYGPLKPTKLFLTTVQLALYMEILYFFCPVLILLYGEFM